jgi:hypothetical protein
MENRYLHACPKFNHVAKESKHIGCSGLFVVFLVVFIGFSKKSWLLQGHS